MILADLRDTSNYHFEMFYINGQEADIDSSYANARFPADNIFLIYHSRYRLYWRLENEDLIFRFYVKILSMSDRRLLNEEKRRNQGLDDADYHIKEAFKILRRETTGLRQEQKAIDYSMSKELDHVNFSSTVNLNVGGHHFTTSVQTLTKDPNSMLAAMFSGRFEMKPSEDGTLFIDRDGTHFRFILNYLRNGKLTLPEGATFLKELEEEAEFYQIQGIIDELKFTKPSTIQASKPTEAFKESVILTNEEHRSVLKSWLHRHDGKWHILFRASQNTLSRDYGFHLTCDNKGPTVTIVKSGNNIFGGFTEVSWKSKFTHWSIFIQV